MGKVERIERDIQGLTREELADEALKAHASGKSTKF
jgi:hypothetical protein